MTMSDWISTEDEPRQGSPLSLVFSNISRERQESQEREPKCGHVAGMNPGIVRS